MAGSVTTTLNNSLKDDFIITCTATGDSGNGSIPAAALSGFWPSGGAYLYQVEIAPGTPAPTNNFGVTLTDALGYDALQGQGANQSSSTPSLIKGNNTFLDTAPTLNITGNSVAAAQITVKLVAVAK